ncbi:MAG TPA: HPF/RaiA family ribosome-associated protein [Planctomycetota bacterium]|nr:HPF/RaiA family ribosome-associated protein [Planctomycetota bacterium]
MDVDIRARHLELRPAQRVLAEKRVASALDRFERRLRRVAVMIEDVNGPKGGADKRCLIRATGERGFAVQAQATDTSIEAAVDRAAGAIGRNVSRAVERRRDFAARDRTSMAGEGRRKRR